MYCRYGCPGEFILHDGGSEFCNEVTEILHKKFGCEVRCTMAGRPQGNGQAEAYIKKLKSKMRYILLEDGNDSGRMKCTWDTIDVHSATFALRATVPEATGVEPAKLLLGRDVVLPNELGARKLLDPKFEGIILQVSKLCILEKLRHRYEHYCHAYDEFDSRSNFQTRACIQTLF